MNHFDLLPLLELNFCFEIFEGLKRVRFFTNELNKTITRMIINERDEIFVATVIAGGMNGPLLIYRKTFSTTSLSIKVVLIPIIDFFFVRSRVFIKPKTID